MCLFEHNDYLVVIIYNKLSENFGIFSTESCMKCQMKASNEYGKTAHVLFMLQNVGRLLSVAHKANSQPYDYFLTIHPVLMRYVMLCYVMLCYNHICYSKSEKWLHHKDRISGWLGVVKGSVVQFDVRFSAAVQREPGGLDTDTVENVKNISLKSRHTTHAHSLHRKERKE